MSKEGNWEPTQNQSQFAESDRLSKFEFCGCVSAGHITSKCQKHSTVTIKTSQFEELVKLANKQALNESKPEENSETCKQQPPIGAQTDSKAANSPKTLDSSHKVPLTLCPQSAIIAIALVIAQGHKKPGREIYNWRHLPISYMQYISAIQRHQARAIDGEDFDEELSELAGVPIRHDWAAMSSYAIIEDARQCGMLIDDRPIKGGAAKFLKEVTVNK